MIGGVKQQVSAKTVRDKYQTRTIVSHLTGLSSPFFGCFAAVRVLWMNGKTPPPAMVARTRVSSSSSPRIANWRCRGVMRFTCRSLDAFPGGVFQTGHQPSQTTRMPRKTSPASSRTSAVRYSRIALVYTAALAPIRTLCWVRCLRKRWIRPTGNYRGVSHDTSQTHGVGHTWRPAFWLRVVVDLGISSPFDFPPITRCPDLAGMVLRGAGAIGCGGQCW